MAPRTFVGSAVPILLAAAAAAPGALLGSGSGGGGAGSREISHDVDFLLTIGALIKHTSILPTQDLTEADVGRAFRATAANTPSFPAAAELLTDGIDYYISPQWFMPGSSHAGNWLESKLFGDQTPNGIDFEGWTVEEIAIRIDRLEIDIPGRDPNGDGIWTDLTWELTVLVYGIPEPATLSLLALGGLAVLCRRRSM
jgi:hypothetical protein